MKKVRVFGIVRDKKLLILNVKKSKSSLKVIRNFLVEIGFLKIEANQILSRLGDSDDNYSAREYKDTLYQDLFLRIKGQKGHCVVIFGKNRIFLVVNKESINRISQHRLEKFFYYS